jgi:hypothetical protein
MAWSFVLHALFHPHLAMLWLLYYCLLLYSFRVPFGCFYCRSIYDNGISLGILMSYYQVLVCMALASCFGSWCKLCSHEPHEKPINVLVLLTAKAASLPSCWSGIITLPRSVVPFGFYGCGQANVMLLLHRLHAAAGCASFAAACSLCGDYVTGYVVSVACKRTLL